MQKIRIVAVGRLKEKFWADAAAEYLKRLSRFAAVEVVEVDDAPDGINAPVREAALILPRCAGKVVLLDLCGKQMSSTGFAAFLRGKAAEGAHLTFVIGGSAGVAPEVRARADYIISFSEMTFPHMLFRVMLLEQIYRGFCINNGSKYHK